MAKTGRKPGFRHSEEIRKKIQATSLINRLTHHALADSDVMTSSQVKAATDLLKLAIPAQKAVELSGDGGGPLTVQIVKFSDTE